MGLLPIRQISKSFIKPKHVLGDTSKPFYLGSYDLVQIAQKHIQTGFMYTKGEEWNAESFVESLMESLSITLSHFYPLAGQLDTQLDEDDDTSIIYVDCNKGPGALFIHAALDDATVNDIISYGQVSNLVPSLFELGHLSANYDGLDAPLLVIQVTQLIDGIFLGISANHSLFDATSFWHFFSSWSEIFQKKNTDISRPPNFNKWFPDGYGPIIKIPRTCLNELTTTCKQSNEDKSLMEMVFNFSSSSISSLKKKVNADCDFNNEISSFQSLCAVLWRSIIRARGVKHEKTTTILIMADARQRVKPPIAQDYFGNFIDMAIVQAKVGELLGNNLGEVAWMLKQAIASVDDNHVRNRCTNWIKSPIFYKNAKPIEEVILIAGTTKDDIYGIEFGLGRPLVNLYAGMKKDGRLMFTSGKDGKGSVSLQICLTHGAINALQQDPEFLSFYSTTL